MRCAFVERQQRETLKHSWGVKCRRSLSVPVQQRLAGCLAVNAPPCSPPCCKETEKALFFVSGFQLWASAISQPLSTFGSFSRCNKERLSLQPLRLKYTFCPLNKKKKRKKTCSDPCWCQDGYSVLRNPQRTSTITDPNAFQVSRNVCP